MEKETKRDLNLSLSNDAFKIALNTLKSELDYNTAILSAKEQRIEQGLQKGIAQNQKDVILKMYKKGMSKEDIANLLDLDINVLNEILNK